jgi:hypothetical protein
VNKGETESDISSDFGVPTEHYENFVSEYPLPFPRDVAEVVLLYTRESPLMQHENCGVRDIDHVVVKGAVAWKRRPIAAWSQNHISVPQERAKRVVDGMPKPIFHRASGVGMPKGSVGRAGEPRIGRLSMPTRKVLLIKLYAVSIGLFPDRI